MTALREFAVDASVPESASFADAAAVLAKSDASALAIVSDDGRVVGLLDERLLLRGLFPAYLRELKHTAFAGDDVDSIQRRRDQVMGQRAAAFATAPLTVEVDASFTHVAERFMHCALQGIALVDRGRYVGMISLDAFTRAIISGV